MTRIFAAAFAVSAVWSIGMAEAAQDSSACPPATSSQVVHASAKGYTMRISARNTCTCRIYFEACSDRSRRRCKSGRISPGETKQFIVDTTSAEGKAEYHWRCG